MPATIRCPICETELAALTRQCPVCGARLSVPAAAEAPARTGMPAYDPTLGEDDLFAPRLLGFPWQAAALLLLLGAVLVLMIGALLGVALLQSLGGAPATPTHFTGRTAVPTLAQPGAAPPGNANADGPTLTPPATLFMPTLTPAPTETPTPPPTSTPTPCEQVVAPGDSLIALASRCGHRHMDVINLIVEMNGLRSADSIQVNQVILIPWPTPTPGEIPTEAQGETDNAGEQSALPGQPLSDQGGGDAMSMGIEDLNTTPTLQPGVMWYTVQRGDTILALAIQFDANVEILSQLNPEVIFSQCDFSLDSGGGSCIVNLYEGQLLRVPAPTPTPTLSPTPSGSETPTPTPTPTFNAPSLLSPGDRAHFRADELITLRWVSTGVLAEDDAYLVTVEDTTAGVTHTTLTTETLFVIPDEWQPNDGQRHTFSWHVAIGPVAPDKTDGLDSITFATDPRLFTWDSPSS